jgi:hypothetical protein
MTTNAFEREVKSISNLGIETAFNVDCEFSVYFVPWKNYFRSDGGTDSLKIIELATGDGIDNPSQPLVASKRI